MHTAFPVTAVRRRMVPTACRQSQQPAPRKLIHINFDFSVTNPPSGVPSTLRPSATPSLEQRVNLSGILVTAEPAHMAAVLDDLSRLPGLEVRGHDANQGHVVVLQEAPDVGAEMDGFMRILALPRVLKADLVCHYFGDEAADGALPAAMPDAAA